MVESVLTKRKGKMFMEEVENNVAVEEIAPPPTNPQESETTQSSPVEDRNDRNWREMRRVNNELERKAKAQEELIANLLKQQMNASPPPSSPADELDSISDDDYLPKGKVKSLLKKEREELKREAREEAKRYWEEQEKANFHQRLKSKFADFDDVVTPETLELLDEQDPELAKTIAELQDPYKIGLQTYKYIRSMGLATKAPAHKRSKEVDKKIEQNAKTVQSPLAFDKRPLAQTFMLTEQVKQDLWKEMNQYAQMASGVPQL